MMLPHGKTQRCTLRDALHVPGLIYNLVSVSKASEVGAVAEFDESGCRFRNSDDKVIATAARCGSLYLMNCRSCEQVNAVCSKEDVWHR